MQKINYLYVMLWATALFVPFLGAAHLFDWDEINFAESAREMMLTKEYFRVQINFNPFWEKPPLFFWLQTTCFSLFGMSDFAARLPNAICGIVTLITCYHIAQKHFNISLAKLWVLFITASFTPHLYFKSGIIDPWFNYFIVLSVYQLYLTIAQPTKRTKHFLLMGLFAGLAVLTKGPVALIVLGLCALVCLIQQKFKPYFSITQLGLFVLIVSSITAIWFTSELITNGPTVLFDFLAYQLDLFLNPVAGHGQPWYYHPIVVLLGCFPASIFALKAFFYTTPGQTNEQILFKSMMQILFWVVLILFSIVKTKIVHYSSLCYLPLTFLAAYYTNSLLQTGIKIPTFKAWIILVFGGIIAVALAVLPKIDVIKLKLIPYIKDDFAVACLNVQANWNGAEWTIGAMFGIMVIIFFMQQYRGNANAAVYSLLLSFSVLLPIYIWQVAPKIEQYSQGPAIDFYKTLQGKNVYVETFGFKSYAQYFYPQQTQHTNPKHNDKNWLFTGNIDKDAYIVAKITSEKECTTLPFTEIGRAGGFIFYKRTAHQHQ